MKIKIDPYLESEGLERDETFKPELSSQLTQQLKADDVDGMLRVLTTAGLTPQHLGRHLTCESNHQSTDCWKKHHSPPSHSVSFSTISHLCMLMQCIRVLKYMAAEQPSLLLSPDDRGSGLLHSLAVASVLQRDGHCKGQARSRGFHVFQSEVFALLSHTEVSESVGSSSTSSLLHALCVMENCAGLRPLEFSLLIGAYSTFHCILNVPGYILTKQVNHGVRVRSTYNLEEYDLMRGERRDKNPMLMLTLISTDQADSLAESKLLEEPVVKKWIDKINMNMMAAGIFKNIFFPTLAMVISPFGTALQVSAALVLSGYHLEAGFLEYLTIMRSRSHDGNSTLMPKDELEKICTPEAVLAFLSNKSNPRNMLVVATSPIFNFSVRRIELVVVCQYVPAVLCLFLLVQALVMVYRTVIDYRALCWLPRKSNYLVQSRFYDASFALCFCSGLTYVVASFLLRSALDCTDYVANPKVENHRLRLLAHVSECAAVMFVFFNLFGLLEVYEMIAKQVAFLSVCFRQMLAKFVHALPLQVLWAYLVFGTLFYVADLQGREFQFSTDVFYSPLRLMLNMADPPHNVSTVALHTLFVLIVSINLHNFLIAFISNAFNQVASNFKAVFILSRLHCSLKTWRYYAFLARFMRGRAEKDPRYVLRVSTLRRLRIVGSHHG